MMALENQEMTTRASEAKSGPEKKIRLLTLLNLTMLLLIVVLYVLFFLSKGGDATQASAHGKVAEKSLETLKIGFINADEFNENFKLARKFRQDLEEEQKRLESDFTRRQRSLQNDIEKFQRDVQTGAASANALQAKEQELMRRQQELVQLNENYSTRLAKRERDMMEEMISVLQDFFDRFNLTRGYDYILRYTPIFGMYHANDKHNITQEVLEMLNAEYDAKIK